MRKFVYSLLILIVLSFSSLAQAATQAIYWPSLLSGFTDTAGIPLADGTVTVYLNDGSSTTATIWEDANKATLAANPITLDAYGAKVRYFDGVYRFILKDADGSTIKDVSDVRITGEVDFGNLFIDLYSTYGDTAPDLQSAITAVGANTATFLWGDHDFIIASNLNFPTNIAHQIQKGCDIQISSGKIVTMNNVIAGGYQFKTGAGTLVIPTANTPIRLPVWSGGTSGVVQSFVVSGSITIDGTVDGVDVSNLNSTVNTLVSSVNILISSTNALTTAMITHNEQIAELTISADALTVWSDSATEYINTLVTSANALTTVQAQHTSTINTLVTSANALTTVQAQHTSTINTLVTSANALTTGKVPYTGATGNVNLGGYGLIATTLTGELQTAAQPNITSVGTLTELNVGATGATAGQIKTGTLLIDVDLLNYLGTDADNQEFTINWRGFNNGTTRYRDFGIANGKNSYIAKFKGSDKSTTLYGGLNVGTATGATVGGIKASDVITSQQGVIVNVSGTDAYGRLYLTQAADGVNKSGLSIGDGTNPRDTNLYRDSANVLKTDDSLIVAGSLGVTQNLKVSGNATIIGTMNVVGDINTVASTTWTPTITVSGGTAPQFSIITAYYKKVGKTVFYSINMQGDGGNEGSGTNPIRIGNLPANIHNNNFLIGSGFYQNGTTYGAILASAGGNIDFVFQKSTTGGTLQGVEQNSTSRAIFLQGNYEAE